MAGIFLSLLYVLRGYGIAAYTHMIYDFIVILFWNEGDSEWAGFAGIVLLNPSAEIGGVADIKSSIFFTMEDIDINHKRRDRDFPLSAGRIPPTEGANPSYWLIFGMLHHPYRT